MLHHLGRLFVTGHPCDMWHHRSCTPVWNTSLACVRSLLFESPHNFLTFPAQYGFSFKQSPLNHWEFAEFSPHHNSLQAQHIQIVYNHFSWNDFTCNNRRLTWQHGRSTCDGNIRIHLLFLPQPFPSKSCPVCFHNFILRSSSQSDHWSNQQSWLCL